eukprot:3865705-Prymnesium_polylepis.1
MESASRGWYVPPGTGRREHHMLLYSCAAGECVCRACMVRVSSLRMLSLWLCGGCVPPADYLFGARRRLPGEPGSAPVSPDPLWRSPSPLHLWLSATAVVDSVRRGVQLYQRADYTHTSSTTCPVF